MKRPIVKKVVTIIGARPQFVKAATVSRELASRLAVKEVQVHTGQHYDANMSAIFFDQMNMQEPKYNLGIGGGFHGSMTGRQLEKIEEVLLIERPDWVLVYGDTNSTLAGALAAVKLHIPVAHVEAGLRSFNRRMPEEINRVLTDHIATLLFAPTEAGKKNLLAEGISEAGIHVTGDVMYDAALHYKERAVRPDWFDSLGVPVGQFLLCTIHRAENTDEPERMRNIFQGLADSGLPVVLPLHPRTRQVLDRAESEVSSNVHIVPPVGYLGMLWLEGNCMSIVTDSGGMQKEAYFHNKLCFTLRDETEWVELVEAGWNVLSPPHTRDWASVLERAARVPDSQVVAYGAGQASKLVVDILLRR